MGNTVLNNSDKDSNQTQPVQKILISNVSEKEKECLLSLYDLKRIHPKKRTPQQNKEIKRLMDKKRKESMSDEKLAKIRKVQAQSKRKSRETLTLEDKTRIKIEDKERKQASREKQSQEDKDKRKKKNEERVQASREKLSQEDKDKKNKENKERV